ncbi:unnamed protein product [Echinostoma caproni]|uniref:DUF5641 domain-containing protein n=1 Tax=Echinostoma caproni TaxID=27848 RepID=A0A183AV19_9TREM|nr:unnamed protein product [Echinostoma caproni]
MTGCRRADAEGISRRINVRFAGGHDQRMRRRLNSCTVEHCGSIVLFIWNSYRSYRLRVTQVRIAYIRWLHGNWERTTERLFAEARVDPLKYVSIRYLQLTAAVVAARQKWIPRGRNFRIGDILLLADERLRRGGWPLAVVKECLLDENRLVRTVKVKTAAGETLRDIRRICYLEGGEAEPTGNPSSGVIPRVSEGGTRIRNDVFLLNNLFKSDMADDFFVRTSMDNVSRHSMKLVKPRARKLVRNLLVQTEHGLNPTSTAVKPCPYPVNREAGPEETLETTKIRDHWA